MNPLPFVAYAATRDTPLPGSVPVTALVLTKNEALNIKRCLTSLAWCDQLIVIDSGSIDDTVSLARSCGAEVIEQPWTGFARQRELAIRHPAVRNEWIYFVDADEWVSAALAQEIAKAVAQDHFVAFAQRFRLIFLGRWIKHCGWYGGSWIVRLGKRGSLSYDPSTSIGERALAHGPTGRLVNDIVNEDRKGLPAWLHKHISYAEAESIRRARASTDFRSRLRAVRSVQGNRPWTRTVAKELIYPAVPVKPLALFCYMYVVRGGWRDGHEGLAFCVLHSWHEFVIQELRRELQTQAAVERAGPAAEIY